MYNVLALDLDGTVLTENQTIHPEVKTAIREVAKRRHVIIVTGRHHTAAYPYYAELGLTTPIICCNGTYIYDYQQNRILKENAIDKKNALTFIELATQHKLKLVMYITNAMIYSTDQPVEYMQAMEAWANRQKTDRIPEIYKTDSFRQAVSDTDYIWKFVVEGDIEKRDILLNSPWVQSVFNAEQSWSNRIDFSAKGNSKGQRLAEYCQALGYLADEVIAVGDNFNDISMLDYAGLGVAMQHADDEVKKHAGLLCTTNNNRNGLALLINEQLKG